MRKFVPGVALLLLAACVQPERGLDRHEGYYYPTVSSSEVFEARVSVSPASDRRARLGFVAGITQQLSELPYPPPYAVFAKGEEAEKLIVIGYGNGQLATVYRARAVFATLTNLLRVGPLMRGAPVDEHATFFDLAKLLGFEQITVSDGQSYTHRIVRK